MATYQFSITDSLKRSSYISDPVYRHNNIKEETYPLLTLIGITKDIKNHLDSKSLNIMDLLNFSKIFDYFSLSDLLGVIAIQKITSNMVSLNINKRDESCLLSTISLNKPSSDPKLTSDIYARQWLGESKVTPVQCNKVFSLLSLWEKSVKDNEKLNLYLKTNLGSTALNCSNAREMESYYNDYLMSNNVSNMGDNSKPYSLIPGERIMVEGYGFIQPIFLFLEPGSGYYLNVRENLELFFSEYVKLHYRYMPIQVVSTLDIFKKYIDTL